MTLPVLKTGCLAWYQSLQEWLPCKVIALPDRDDIAVQFTTNVGPCDRGDIILTTILHVVPRQSLHSKRGSYGTQKYVSRFTVECDQTVHQPKLTQLIGA